MSRILIVEDEEHLAEGLAFNLRNAGYHVDIAATGAEGQARTASSPPDLILLDVMLPDANGLEITRNLRRSGTMCPILMVSARDRAEDAIAGLDAGADDYIFKPYDLDEVLARIRGALRRQVWSRDRVAEPSDRTLRFGRWEVDFRTYRAVDDQGGAIELSPREIGMLALFGSRPGEVVSREDFLEEVWGLPGSLETRTVDNFIRRLRQALEDEPSNPRHIVSVRGAGYRFVP